MPLHDIFQKVKTDQKVRDDFVDTLVQFAQRHGIKDAAHKDFDFQVKPGAAATLNQGSTVDIYRDGPRTSRWIDSG